MSRSNNGGWDFIKEGNIYQYKEDSMIAMVIIQEDNSGEKYYKFKIKILASNYPEVGKEVEIFHIKNVGGYFSGMLQFYKTAQYIPLPVGTPWPYAEEGAEVLGMQEI